MFLRLLSCSYNIITGITLLKSNTRSYYPAGILAARGQYTQDICDFEGRESCDCASFDSCDFLRREKSWWLRWSWSWWARFVIAWALALESIHFWANIANNAKPSDYADEKTCFFWQLKLADLALMDYIGKSYYDDKHTSSIMVREQCQLWHSGC